MEFPNRTRVKYSAGAALVGLGQAAAVFSAAEGITDMAVLFIGIVTLMAAFYAVAYALGRRGAHA